MKFICLCLMGLLAASTVHGQLPTPKPTVYIYVANAPYPLSAVTSQTEAKRGWDIQGISVGRKTMRYFWGRRAVQQTDSRPTFAIYPRQESLNDYALIRLKEKREYRLLPKAVLTDCPYTRVDLKAFRIENLPDMGFAVTPLAPLAPGEYILVNLAQEPVGELQDIRVFPFSVREEK